MKKIIQLIIYSSISLIFSIISLSQIYAESGAGILGKDNSLTMEKLRSGDLTIQSIPDAIVSVISTLLAVAGTVAIFSLIYHAVQMQINSGITGDSSGVDKAKK